MIQINLLPDVKQQFIKTRRTKRLILLVCSVAVLASLSVLGLLFLITDVQQTRSIANLSEEIEASLQELQETEDLDKILTVQKQLDALDILHTDKTDATRLYTYLPQILPEGVTLDDLKINYDSFSVEISGAAPTLGDVNTFVDTLKFAEYTLVDEVADDFTDKAFSEVVLASNSRDDDLTRFTITASFVEDLFITRVDNVQLLVPNTVTTRSETEQPGVLFENSGGDDEQ